MANTVHDKIANNLARKFGTEYHSDKGVDLRTATRAIEIESHKEALPHAKQQLAGTTRTPYIAVPKSIVKDALEATRGTRFGVMSDTGRVIKRGSRKR